MNQFTIHEALDKLTEEHITFSFHGNSSLIITHARSIEEADDFSVSFFRGSSFEKIETLSSKNNLIILREGFETQRFRSGNFILTDSPDLSFCIIGALLKEEAEPVIHASANISECAVIGSAVSIGQNVQIGKDVVIGNRVAIGSGCSIFNATIGDDCEIAAGVKIGGSGLGSHKHPLGKWCDFPHFGRVIIGSSVVIQENTVIHRGSLRDTTIHDGVRIGPLCWIAHGVQVGDDCFIGQGVTIAGSSKVLSRAQIWANVAIKDGVVVSEDAIVGMGAAVISDIPRNELWVGNPAKYKKQIINYKK